MRRRRRSFRRGRRSFRRRGGKSRRGMKLRVGYRM